jgi:predicted Zn-dependent protease with MMP-like domain
MHFLRSEFIDQLRAEIDYTTGNVVIEAAQFTPQQILEFNNETFELAFEGWCETQKEQRLEKAEKILKDATG